MDMSFESRPRLIDRLRLFHIFSRHFGDKDAEAAIDALQDEFAPLSTSSDFVQMRLWMQSELNALRVEVNAAIIKITATTALIAGIALAIARLT